jgi:hypothetical protein
VRKQVPLERLIVMPNRMVMVPEEAFVVLNDVGDHQRDDSEGKIFWTKTRRGSNLDG